MMMGVKGGNLSDTDAETIALSSGPLRLHSLFDALKAGALTCEMLARHCLAQEEEHRHLNAFIKLNPSFLSEARQADERRAAGEFLPLHGMPIAIKDNIETIGIETTGGAAALAGYVPRRDATVVARLKAAGALIIGKTNLDELAGAGSTMSSMGGRTLNPFDSSRTPAGSSGGSAVAVAIGACVLALGTETVNSIRNPAHVCGVAGLRPTRGLVSRAGVIPVSPTMDVVGPLAAGIEDLATVFALMVGSDPGDPATCDAARYEMENLAASRWPKVGGLRVGVLRGLFGHGPEHDAVNRLLEIGLRRLKDAGATPVEIDDPVFDSRRLYDELALHAFEFQPALNGWLSALGTDAPVSDMAAYVADGRWPSATMKGLLETAMATPDPAANDDYRDKLRRIETMRTLMTALMCENFLDAFAYPAQQRTALLIGEPSRPERNGVLASALGWPALNVPIGFTKIGEGALPVGIDLMARPFAEPLLFALGRIVETACPRWI